MINKALNYHKYYDYEFCPLDIDQVKIMPKKKGFEKFIQFLPITNIQISLGEGNTPLTKAKSLSKLINANVFIKHEQLNPTGSFKDRETMVITNWLLENKPTQKQIAISSSGNAALSAAAYAQVAGMKCTCFVPTGTTANKKHLIELYGARCEEVKGNYEYVYRYLADEEDKYGVNITAGIDPIRVEGNKTIAYEFFLDEIIPDYVIVPCGNGGNLAGIWKGFSEMKRKGYISKIPHMIGVQIKGASPLAKSLKLNQEFAILHNIPNSIAEGIIAQESYCSPKVMQAIHDTQGRIIEVDDHEIRKAGQQIIESESLVLEPTSYSAFAALNKLEFPPDSQIAVIATGTGLKLVDEVQDLFLE